MNEAKRETRGRWDYRLVFTHIGKNDFFSEFKLLMMAMYFSDIRLINVQILDYQICFSFFIQ